jgi:integrase
MRIKASFTVFPRKLLSGRTVFYFQCYDENGARLNGRSTGCSKKTEATAYCLRLYREGKLLPRKKTLTFEEFCEGWWDIETCEYLRLRQLSNPLSENTIDLNRDNTRNYLKDFFGPYQLGEITVETVKAWILEMGQKGLAASTINGALKTLRVMLDEAVSKGMMTGNAAKEVKELRTEGGKRIILTLDELDRLFPEDWETVWNNPVIYRVHLIASCTGMRIAEIMGLKGDKVFEDHIQVSAQYGQRHGYKDKTKTKHDRDIPITAEIVQLFNPLLKANGGGYVFSENAGVKPVSYARIHRALEKAFETIGINREEQKKRKLTIHSWRHFFNTILRNENVTDAKVQSVTGHLTQKEMDRYTHFDTRQFNEVRAVQAKLLATGNGARGKVRAAKTGEANAEMKQRTGKEARTVKKPAAGKREKSKPGTKRTKA